jgi:hypothetical protein
MINGAKDLFHVYGKREITHLDVETTNGKRQRRQNYGHLIAPDICGRKIREAGYSVCQEIHNAKAFFFGKKEIPL